MKGYLVTYDTGSYDTFFIHNVGVCLTEEKAKEMVKKIDNEHKIPESMFESNPDTGENPRSFWAIQYKADMYQDEHPEEFPDPFEKFNKPYYELSDEDRKIINEISNENERKGAELLLKFVMKTYPEWNEETAKKAIALEDKIEYMQQEEYGRASYEEIEIFE